MNTEYYIQLVEKSKEHACLPSPSFLIIELLVEISQEIWLAWFVYFCIVHVQVRLAQPDPHTPRKSLNNFYAFSDEL